MLLGLNAIRTFHACHNATEQIEATQKIFDHARYSSSKNNKKAHTLSKQFYTEMHWSGNDRRSEENEAQAANEEKKLWWDIHWWFRQRKLNHWGEREVQWKERKSSWRMGQCSWLFVHSFRWITFCETYANSNHRSPRTWPHSLPFFHLHVHARSSQSPPFQSINIMLNVCWSTGWEPT